MIRVRRAAITKCRHCPGKHWIVACWRQPNSIGYVDFHTHAEALRFAIERTGQ